MRIPFTCRRWGWVLLNCGLVCPGTFGFANKMTIITSMMDTDLLPDVDFAKEFYAKYDIKEVLGKWVSHSCLFSEICWVMDAQAGLLKLIAESCSKHLLYMFFPGESAALWGAACRRTHVGSMLWRLLIWLKRRTMSSRWRSSEQPLVRRWTSSGCVLNIPTLVSVPQDLLHRC